MKTVAPFLSSPVTSGLPARKRDRTRRLVTVLSITGLLALLLLSAACSDDEATVTYPTPPQPASKLWMYDVFGNDANDVYACGSLGTMAHYDGTNWSPVEMNASKNVVAIWGAGDGTLYACGGGGSVWKNSSGSWNSMVSGTSDYLVGLGSFNGDIHVSGRNGALQRLSGGSWVDTKTVMIVREPEGAPLDTLSRRDDIESLVTVNHYFIGGAYRLPTYDRETSIGLSDTDGMVLGLDIYYPEEPSFDWQLRPLRADEIAASEWIQCSTSDDEILGNNYLGTSEGWVFQLSLNESNRLVWAKMYPRITSDPRAAINDMWLDASGNLYLVTHDGRLVFQSNDYNFKEDIGYRVEKQVTGSSLMGLWGSDPDHLFAVGLVEKTVFRYRYDTTTAEFIELGVDEINFDEKSLSARVRITTDQEYDKFGRPISW